MDIKELRIGNIVLAPRYRSEGIHMTEVKTISKQYADNNGKYELNYVINYATPETGAQDIILIDGDIKPIPLTEEWLMKFGFKKYNKYGWYEINNYNQINLKGDYLVNGIQCISNKIYNVHQLQNLYFAQTGEELELR